MIHRGSLDYLIIIPSGVSCHWHITHRLFSPSVPRLPLFTRLSIPGALEMTLYLGRGGS